ncbi:MAG: helix-turn-helix transcriptional regulator [Endozoicomonas sp.]|uniref:helix-turn-helix transcriptional regulator n=1 Tax=Endozoicomonas sp. TaxID=1892382 RepID=UPI003D9BCA8A
MSNKLLSRDQVKNLVSEGTMTEQSFPKPVRLPFSNLPYWLKSDIQQWLLDYSLKEAF